jgi:hypothetical protein
MVDGDHVQRSLLSGLLALLMALPVGACADPIPKPPAPAPPEAPAEEPVAEPAAGEVISQAEFDEALAVRTMYGLRADATWIRAVAGDPASAIGLREFGIPLLPSELEDLQSRRWPHDLLIRVQNYGRLFPDTYAGARINLEATGIVISFTEDIERHTAALANLVDPGEVVTVRPARWSLKELEGFIEIVEAEAAWFESMGLTFKAGHRSTDDWVYAKYRGPMDLEPIILARFGDPPWLRAEWDGPLPWEGPRADLHIKVTDSDGQVVTRVRCDHHAIDPMVDASGATLSGTDDDGVCRFDDFPVAEYQIRLHEWIEAEGMYDDDPIRTLHVILEPEGTLVEVVLPAP